MLGSWDSAGTVSGVSNVHHFVTLFLNFHNGALFYHLNVNAYTSASADFYGVFNIKLVTSLIWQ